MNKRLNFIIDEELWVKYQHILLDEKKKLSHDLRDYIKQRVKDSHIKKEEG